jgi:hypothetical protein
VSDKERTTRRTNFEVLEFEEEFIPRLDLFVDRSIRLVLSFEVLEEFFMHEINIFRELI